MCSCQRHYWCHHYIAMNIYLHILLKSLIFVNFTDTLLLYCIYIYIYIYGKLTIYVCISQLEMKSLQELCQGLPLEPLPPHCPLDESVPHAPVKTHGLSVNEKKVGLYIQHITHAPTCCYIS